MARLRVARMLPEERRLMERAIEVRTLLEELGDEYEQLREQLVEVVDRLGGCRVFRGVRFELRTRKYYAYPKKVRRLMDDLKKMTAEVKVEQKLSEERETATVKKETTYLTMELPK